MADVQISSVPYGTGREVIIVGDNVFDVAAVARSIVNSVDFMQSPSISQQARPQADGKVVARVVYFGLD